MHSLRLTRAVSTYLILVFLDFSTSSIFAEINSSPQICHKWRFACNPAMRRKEAGPPFNFRKPNAYSKGKRDEKKKWEKMLLLANIFLLCTNVSLNQIQKRMDVLAKFWKKISNKQSWPTAVFSLTTKHRLILHPMENTSEEPIS